MQTPDLRVPDYLGRVLQPDGTAVGTCFQVAQGVIITAAHVLADINAATAGTVVKIDPLRGGAAREATVLRVEAATDLALLTTTHPLDHSVVGLVATDTVAMNTQVLVTGVPVLTGTEGHRHLDAPGTWAGTASPNGQKMARISSRDVLPGMSGAPVLLVGDLRVAGVVSGRYNSADGWFRDSVWVARTEPLAELCASEAALDIDAAPPLGSSQRRVEVLEYDAAAISLAVSGLLRHLAGNYISLARLLRFSNVADVLNALSGRPPSDRTGDLIDALISAMYDADFFSSTFAAAAFLRGGDLRSDATRLQQKLRLVEPDTSLHEQVTTVLSGLELPRRREELLAPHKEKIDDDRRLQYKTGMSSFYRSVQEETRPSDLRRITQVGFQGKPFWDEHLLPVPSAAERSHIAYSNQLIARQCVSSFAAPPRRIRVVDGGCGQGALLLNLCNEVSAQWRDNVPDIDYYGCDLNPFAVIVSNELMNLKRVIADKASVAVEALAALNEFRGVVSPLVPDGTWTDRRHYVDWEDMVIALDRLAQEPRAVGGLPIAGSVDLVVFSYSFHHVPNNKAFAESLTSGPGFDGIALEKLARLGRELLQADVPRRFPTGRAGLFAEATLDPTRPWAGRHALPRDVGVDLRGLSQRSSVGHLAQYVVDEQALMVATAATLLRPGGILAIADPDGMSLWNRDNLSGDVEIPFAHFLTDRQCAALLDSTGGLEYLPAESRRIVFPIDQPSYYDVGIEESVLPGRVHTIAEMRSSGFKDDNLGFVLFARRVRHG